MFSLWATSLPVVLNYFFSKSADARVRRDLNLSRSGQITFLRVGGRTVGKLSKFDLHVVRRLQPQVVILEIGSNNLSPPDARLEVVDCALNIG